MTGIDPLEHLTGVLEQTAARLRDEQLKPQEAARIVEECARIAGEAASALDRRAREAGDR